MSRFCAGGRCDSKRETNLFQSIGLSINAMRYDLNAYSRLCFSSVFMHGLSTLFLLPPLISIFLDWIRSGFSVNLIIWKQVLSCDVSLFSSFETKIGLWQQFSIIRMLSIGHGGHFKFAQNVIFNRQTLVDLATDPPFSCQAHRLIL